MMRYGAPLAAIVVALFVGGIWWVSQGGGTDSAFAQCSATQIAGDGNQIGGPFELVNGDGETVSEQVVITEPALSYFGYTFCPDVCPLDTARNAEAVDILTERGLSVSPVFISIDPERDTPDALAEFVPLFGAGIIGLTGTPEQIAETSETFPIFFELIEEAAAPDGYTMGHTSHLFLFDPQAGFAASWAYGTPAEEILADLKERL